jgi:hypothetical protein
MFLKERAVGQSKICSDVLALRGFFPHCYLYEVEAFPKAHSEAKLSKVAKKIRLDVEGPISTSAAQVLSQSPMLLTAWQIATSTLNPSVFVRSVISAMVPVLKKMPMKSLETKQTGQKLMFIVSVYNTTDFGMRVTNFCRRS